MTREEMINELSNIKTNEIIKLVNNNNLAVLDTMVREGFKGFLNMSNDKLRKWIDMYGIDLNQSNKVDMDKQTDNKLYYYDVNINKGCNSTSIGIISPEPMEEDELLQFGVDNGLLTIDDTCNANYIKELTREEYGTIFDLSTKYRVTYINNEGKEETLGYYTREEFWKFAKQHKKDNQTDTYMTEIEYNWERI